MKPLEPIAERAAVKELLKYETRRKTLPVSLMGATGCLTADITVAADSIDAANTTLEEIVVTGLSIAQSANNSSAAATILTHQDIARTELTSASGGWRWCSRELRRVHRRRPGPAHRRCRSSCNRRSGEPCADVRGQLSLKPGDSCSLRLRTASAGDPYKRSCRLARPKSKSAVKSQLYLRKRPAERSGVRVNWLVKSPKSSVLGDTQI